MPHFRKLNPEKTARRQTHLPAPDQVTSAGSVLQVTPLQAEDLGSRREEEGSEEGGREEEGKEQKGGKGGGRKVGREEEWSRKRGRE